MSMLENSLDAQARLQRIRVATWNRRWWEARELLSEAESQQDWKLLGHASWEDYLAVAYVVRGRPQQQHV